jgi:hypothetical protein
MQRRARMITPLAARRAGRSLMPVLGYGLLCVALYLTAPGDVWGTRHGRHSPVRAGDRVEVSAVAHGSRVQAARVRLIDAEGTAARTARSVE